MPSQADTFEVVANRHIVRPGESLLELAYEGGFDGWKKVWNDEANARIRELRKDPQILLPGDELVIPDRETSPKESCPVDKVHRFRITRPRAWVNLRMLDRDGEPLASRRFELRIEHDVHDGETDSDGFLSVEIDPQAHAGQLTVWLDEERRFDAVVKVGHLDPATEPSGMKARLVNLGAERIFGGPTGHPSGDDRPAMLGILSLDDFADAFDDDLGRYLETQHEGAKT